MQKRQLIALSLMMSLMLFAFEVKNDMFDLQLDPKGATLNHLAVQGKKWGELRENKTSFDDQLGQNQDDNLQRIEYTKNLEFALREMTISAAETKVAFSVRSLAYPGIRLEKIYLFSAKKPEFTLRWELKNTGKEPIALSLNTRALLFRENMSNRYLHPQGKTPSRNSRLMRNTSSRRLQNAPSSPPAMTRTTGPSSCCHQKRRLAC